MYRIEDKKSAIKEVQKFLFAIYNEAEEITRVAIDGIYGDETQTAVSEFQGLNGLNSSGVVDRSTFDILYNQYSSIVGIEKLDEYILTDASFPIKLGDIGEDILIINMALRELRKTYKDICRVDKSMYYSKSTEQAVKDMQRIFRLSEDGIVTQFFYDRMQKEIKAINLVKSSSKQI